MINEEWLVHSRLQTLPVVIVPLLPWLGMRQSVQEPVENLAIIEMCGCLRLIIEWVRR